MPSALQMVKISHRNILAKGKQRETHPVLRVVDSDVQMTETFGKERETQPASWAVYSDVQMAEITKAPPAFQVVHPHLDFDIEMMDVQQKSIPTHRNLLVSKLSRPQIIFIFKGNLTQENIILREVSINDVYALFCFDGFNHSQPFHFPEIKTHTGRPKFLSMPESRETQWYYWSQPYISRLCSVGRCI